MTSVPIGPAGSAEPVSEVLPARTLGTDLFELAGSPGLVLGCAAGDALRGADDGQFVAGQTDGNFSIRASRTDPSRRRP